MSGKQQKSVRPQWDGRIFDRFQSARPADVVAADERRLAELFNSAAWQSELVQKPLGWMHSVDGHFYVDHDCEAVQGYYMPGTGTVALSARILCLSPPAVADTLVHEIRHCYQDNKGWLVHNSSDFADYYIKRALLEADAHAHGLIVRAVLQGQDVGDPKAFMQAAFRSWYSDWDNHIYGYRAVQMHAEKLGIGTPFNFYHDSSDKLASPDVAGHGISLDSYRDVVGLGASFHGFNYLTGAPMRDFLVKKALSRTCAMTFFNRMRQQPQPRENNIRKEMLSRKRAQGDGFFI